MAIGQKIASTLVPGDVLALNGELGSGKTHLTKGIAAGLRVDDADYVNSPAFDLIHEYSGAINVYHMDFYRMDYLSPEDYPWLEEYLESDGICVIEWADKFIAELSDRYINIELAYVPGDDNARQISISTVGGGTLSQKLMDALEGIK